MHSTSTTYDDARSSRAEQLAAGLGWFSVGLGLAELASPGSIARLTGTRDESGHTTLRAFGARELGNGLAILAQPHQAAWMWSRVAGDAIDLAYLASAMRDDHADRTRLGASLAAVLGVTALDVIAAVQLGRAAASEASPRRARPGTVRVEKTVTINRPAHEVYSFWRNLENLPQFMRHLESVETLDQRRSRWRAKAPAGMRVEWEAEILQDRDQEWLAWRSVEGSEIENSGSVRFSPAPGARGTEVRIQLQYSPPAGRVGRIIARLFGEEPEQQIEEDLRRFKQLMETGVIPVSEGPGLWRAAQPPADVESLRALTAAGGRR